MPFVSPPCHYGPLVFSSFWYRAVGAAFLIIMICGFQAPRALAAEKTAATAAARPSIPQIQKAAQELAAALGHTPDPAEMFIALAKGGAPFDPEAAASVRYMVECRRGQRLAQLAGIYRTDMLYTAAFSSSVEQPLEATLQKMELPDRVREALAVPSLTQGLLLAEQGAVTARELGAQLRRGEVRATVMADGDAVVFKALLDMHYAQLLQQMHIVGRLSGLLSPAELARREGFVRAWGDISQRLDSLRGQLLAWSAQPVLVRELGLHRQLSHMDSLLLELEIARAAAGTADPAWLGKMALLVDEARGDMVQRCPPPEDPRKSQEQWKLNPRDDLFKPQNFF